MARLSDEKALERVEQFIQSAASIHNKELLSVSEIKRVGKEADVAIPGAIWACRVSDKPVRFSLPLLAEKNGLDYAAIIKNPIAIAPRVAMSVAAPAPVAPAMSAEQVLAVSAKPIVSDENWDMYIPQMDPKFVPYGDNYKMVEQVVAANDFFPTYLTGISGVGKTATVRHICAKHRRPFFRAQITRETVDEDLIGSMKLLNGDTVWSDGPVLKAYRSGGILLLDEIDLNNTLMVLQPILERQPFYVKQTGELVHPNPGFTVFATGNTKGDGSDSRFIGTTVLNDAFMDRFALMLIQELPPIDQERKIAMRACQSLGVVIPAQTMNDLMRWVDLSRQSFSNGSVDVYVSTRRVGYILKAFKFTNDMSTALNMCLSRFNDDTRNALILMWESVSTPKEAPVSNTDNEPKSVPF